MKSRIEKLIQKVVKSVPWSKHGLREPVVGEDLRIEIDARPVHVPDAETRAIITKAFFEL